MLLPNIPTETLGGKFFWKTIDEKFGWKLQKNIVTTHYRVLNNENVRQAWSLHKRSIKRAFAKFTDDFS